MRINFLASLVTKMLTHFPLVSDLLVDLWFVTGVGCGLVQLTVLTGLWVSHWPPLTTGLLIFFLVYFIHFLVFWIAFGYGFNQLWTLTKAGPEDQKVLHYWPSEAAKLW